MPHITRHLLVPEARQADAHECPAGAGGRHGPRGGSEPSRLAPRAQTRTQGRRGVWCTRPGAPCGARSRCFPWCRARCEIFVGVGDSHGPYEWPTPSRRAPRARTIRAWGLVVLVRPRGAPRGARRGAVTRGEPPHVLGAHVISRSGVVGCLYPPLFRNSENYRWFGFSLYMSIFSHRELF